MSDVKLTRVVRITNPQGLHMRPITALLEKSKQFNAEVTLVKDHNRVSVRHVIDMLTLAVVPGSEVTLEASGPDAAAALEALAHVIEHEFIKYDEENIIRPLPPSTDAKPQ